MLSSVAMDPSQIRAVKAKAIFNLCELGLGFHECVAQKGAICVRRVDGLGMKGDENEDVDLLFLAKPLTIMLEFVISCD